MERPRIRVALEPLGEDLPGARRIVTDQRAGAERPLPRRGLECRRPAEAEHGRARLRGHRLPVRRGVGDEHVRPRRRIVRGAVDREGRPPRGNEVQLLMGQGRILGVRLDDVLSRLAGRVRVAAERLDPKRPSDRMPGEASGAGNRLELIQVDDLGRLGHRERGKASDESCAARSARTSSSGRPTPASSFMMSSITSCSRA